MTIPEISALTAGSTSALEHSRHQKSIVLVYSAVLTGSSVLVLLLDYILSRMIADTGGLSALGTRSILFTLQAMLPIVQFLVLLGWDAGYSMAMLKMIRQEHPDQRTLSSGSSLFFPMLRRMLLESMIYFNILMVSLLLAGQIYTFTPWAKDLMQILEPVLPDILNDSTQVVLEDALVLPALQAMLPMVLIFGILYLVLFIPISYRLRFSTFCLVDGPKAGAIRAMAASRMMLRGNCLRLFRIDLHFWWYHGLLAIASLIQMLPMMGLTLPLGFDLTYYLCNGVYLLMVFGVYVLARNRVECTYAAAYESLRERPEENAVVLGNIFDMQ